MMKGASDGVDIVCGGVEGRVVAVLSVVVCAFKSSVVAFTTSDLTTRFVIGWK